MTSGGGQAEPDLTEWTFWWEFNKDPYLDLKTRIRRGEADSGIEGFFFGQSPQRALKDAFRPSEQQIRNEVVPALVRALEGESNNDIVTGCLVALAKIGDAPDESGASRLAPLLARSLASKTLEIRETAAVALGILAHRSGIEVLEALVEGGPAGRALVGQSEVDVRTRTFAAYGLGLIGSRAHDTDRERIVARLGRTLEAGAARDLEVACVIALGLVPVATIESLVQPEERDGRVPPETSRLAQLDFLLALLRDRTRDHLVRAHCPTALARLMTDLPPELHAAQRAAIAEECLARLEPRAREQNEVVQSAVQALGLLGTNDDASALDRRIRQALSKVEGDVSARNFALIALAKLGARTVPGATDPEGGLSAVRSTLLAELTDGKGQRRSWAALACGVLGHELARSGPAHGGTLDALQRAVRQDLAAESKNPSHLGALAVAAGLLGDVESKALLVERLRRERDASARGYVALGLGLMNAREALEELETVVAGSRYQPDLLKQASIALGLMGDKSAVPALIEQLESAKGLATQAALSKALGFIGDRRSIEPLTRMLANQDLTGGARGFAAVALGIVADKEGLPWNARIALDLNYRAATPTLTSATAGTGILDIL